MIKINTGNYRLCREQIGISGTFEILESFISIIDAIEALNLVNRESNWEYYCQEEVFYRGTQLSQSRTPTDSTKSWIRLHH